MILEITKSSKNREQQDTSLIALRDKYVDNKKQIGYWYSQPIDSRPANLKETEDQAEKQEKELTRKSEAFSKEIKLLNTSWSDVQQKLLKNEAAIELFPFVTSKKWSKYFNGALVARQVNSPNLFTCLSKNNWMNY